MHARLHICGASGAGVSTLGRALAERLDAAWFDTDDFYWVWDGEPYTTKRSIPDRLTLLGRVLDGAPRWVLSGSLDGWGDPLIRRFEAVVFVSTPTPVRLDRLRARELARFGEGEGYPDGMTVDAEGCLWIAFWDGWCVRRFSPEGERLAELKLPVARPTSCAFGGSNLDRLFVTSASIGLSVEDKASQPQAGGLFLLEPGVRGLADTPFGG